MPMNAADKVVGGTKEEEELDADAITEEDVAVADDNSVGVCERTVCGDEPRETESTLGMVAAGMVRNRCGDARPGGR